MRGLLCAFFIVLARTGEGRDDDEYDTMRRLRSQQKPGTFPLPYDEPVPFGHITRDGFGDPFSAIRPPFDAVELSLRSPKDKAEALELLKKAKGSEVLFTDPRIPTYFSRANPKEALLLERYVDTPKEVNETKIKWYDLPTMQARNAMMPNKEQYIARKKIKLPEPRHLPPPPPPGEKSASFSKASFSLGVDEVDVQFNWTTCDQFAVGAVFAPKDVINVRWTPFFIWDSQGMHYSTEHTFEIPSNRLVNEYHFKYSKMISKTVDWTKAKLLMKGIMEALLIAADKRGLFHVIGKHQIPDSVTGSESKHKLPSLTMRLKIEDPYLVLMYCEQYFAAVMAVSGNEPTEAKEMETEAATVKFKGIGRPVWRHFDDERERAKLMKEGKMREEEDKIIFVNDPLPPIGQWD